MNFAKKRKDELLELADELDASVDEEMTKAEIVEELDSALDDWKERGREAGMTDDELDAFTDMLELKQAVEAAEETDVPLESTEKTDDRSLAGWAGVILDESSPPVVDEQPFFNPVPAYVIVDGAIVEKSYAELSTNEMFFESRESAEQFLAREQQFNDTLGTSPLAEANEASTTEPTEDEVRAVWEGIFMKTVGGSREHFEYVDPFNARWMIDKVEGEWVATQDPTTLPEGVTPAMFAGSIRKTVVWGIAHHVAELTKIQQNL